MQSGAFQSFLGVGQGTVKSKVKSKPIGDANELRVESKRSKRLREYDRLLKSFKYSAALDSVLRQVCLSFRFALSADVCLRKSHQQRHLHWSKNSFIVMDFG